MPTFPPRPTNTESSGPHAIRVMDNSLRDRNRARVIPVRFYIPLLDHAPLVFVSHGTGGDRTSYSYLGAFLASHGFWCVHPTHIGSDSSLLTSQRFSTNREAILRASSDPEQWEARPLDIQFLLDHLPDLEATAGLRADAAKSIVGHSFGAYTAVALAGAQAHLPGGIRSFDESRLSCFVAISPFGEGGVFESDSWSTARSPLFYVTGTEDTGLQGEPATHRTEPFARLPAGRKWLAVIDGAPHLSFTDPLPFNDRPDVRAKVQTLVLAFLTSAQHAPQLFETALNATSGVTWQTH